MFRHELMALNRVNPSEGPSRLLMRIHDFVDLRERQTTFEGLGAYEMTALNLGTGEGPPDFILGANVTANTFDLLRTAPALGRSFTAGDEVIGASAVAVIRHGKLGEQGLGRIGFLDTT